MGLIKNQQRICLVAERAQHIQIAGQIANHTDIGHHRFSEHTGDIAAFQFAFQRMHIVKLDNGGGGQQVMHLPDQALPQHRGRTRGMAAQVDKDIVDRTMIAAIEDQDFLPPRNPPAPADDRAIGFARRGGDLPIGQAEHDGKPVAELRRTLCRQYSSAPHAPDWQALRQAAAANGRTCWRYRRGRNRQASGHRLW
jgi:hypothetical protein